MNAVLDASFFSGIFLQRGIFTVPAVIDEWDIRAKGNFEKWCAEG